MNNDKENKKKSELTDTSKADKKDIGNSLEQDVTNTPLPKDKTPQGRTDNEEDRETKKNR
ncbi:hypothetical protein [Pontibacter chitinilyticus]|uniref:hypothetical protein n=1 Tax=Pontibacter chitinilyticus TaxID=2674989 RepID=UPI00321909B2